MVARTNQEYIEEIFKMDEEPHEGVSEITQFYSDCNIFITGGSGFIGKLLIEKLLRCCSNMGKLYMLMRSKKGKSSEDRFKEFFNDPLYDRLKCEQPNFEQKVIMIEGDTGAPDLGISEENRKFLIENTHIIFHGAANVKFDEKLRKMVETNIRCVKLLFLLAKEITNFKAFVHISTAFSHCPLKFIDEVYYPPPIEAKKLLDLIELLDDSVLDHITPVLQGKWPNTYAFSKAIAEDFIQKYSTGIPTCIVRPSIVISTYKEPICGWTNNIYGATGVVVGAGLGLLRTLYCEETNIADIIPADYVINNIIVAAWDTAQTWNEKQKEKAKLSDAEDLREDPIIYNSVSSCQNPITWGEFLKMNEIYGLQVPSRMTIWYFFFRLNRYKWIHDLSVFFLHLVPALLADIAAILIGRKPILLNTYKKIHKFSGVISYFSTQQWKFRNDHVVKLWQKINAVDQIKFNFMVTNLDWDEYFQYHVKGLRVFILKDPMETLDIGCKKYMRLKVAHYILMTLFWLLVAWIAIKLLNYSLLFVYSFL